MVLHDMVLHDLILHDLILHDLILHNHSGIHACVFTVLSRPWPMAMPS